MKFGDRLASDMESHHPLARWRKDHDKTLVDLAQAAGCAVSQLSQIESGKTKPSLTLIAKLETTTGGAVKAEDFMPAESAPAARAHVSVGKIRFGNELRLSIIAGPCQLESREHALEVAGGLAKLAKKLKLGLVYKTSFDKANRTSGNSTRGIGIDKAIPIFKEIRARTGLPVLTDVHEIEQCGRLSEAVDVLQIPAFLCRQTDLLVAAAQTGCVINVKKGQFLAPWDMKNVVEKITSAGNRNVIVTERGASFGYNTLVSDLRSLPILARTTGAPVVFDATHSVQEPGGQGTASGGKREFVPVLARAAVAVGVAGVFIDRESVV